MIVGCATLRNVKSRSARGPAKCVLWIILDIISNTMLGLYVYELVLSPGVRVGLHSNTSDKSVEYQGRGGSGAPYSIETSSPN